MAPGAPNGFLRRSNDLALPLSEVTRSRRAILDLATRPENAGTEGYVCLANQCAADLERCSPTAQQRGNDEGESRVEYKVVTQKDRMFGGKFNPEQVQNGLNSYAEEGWVLKAVATATFPSLGGGREELVMFLEREK